MSEDSKDHTVEITVNSAEFTVPKGKISYAAVVQSAFPGTTVTMPILSNTSKGNTAISQACSRWAPSISQEGMNFRVSTTGES